MKLLSIPATNVTRGAFQAPKVVDFKQNSTAQDPLEGDKLIIRTPKEGLVKQNSFLNPNLELRDKDPYSKAVYATGDIGKGEIVCIFVGDILTEKELKQLPQGLQKASLQLAPKIYQIGSKNPDNKKGFDAAEFFRHSCDANLYLTGNNILIAARDIKPGEELCYDYGTSDTQGNPDTEGFKCECHSPNCRGDNSPEAYKTIIPKMQEKYGKERGLDFVAQYIKEMFLAETKGQQK